MYWLKVYSDNVDTTYSNEYSRHNHLSSLEKFFLYIIFIFVFYFSLLFIDAILVRPNENFVENFFHITIFLKSINIRNIEIRNNFF